MTHMIKRKKRRPSRIKRVKDIKNSNTRELMLVLVITTVIVTTITLSKYRSALGREYNVQSVANPKVNITTVQDIELSAMKPGDEIAYFFSVNNYSLESGETISDTELEYTIELQTGRYLPITVELYEIENGIVQNTNLLAQTTVTPSKILGLTRESHEYKLKIKWAASDNDYRYSSEIDYLKLVLRSHQINPM